MTHVSFEDMLRALDIDPSAPLTPVVVGQGRDIWGLHPPEGVFACAWKHVLVHLSLSLSVC